MIEESLKNLREKLCEKILVSHTLYKHLLSPHKVTLIENQHHLLWAQTNVTYMRHHPMWCHLTREKMKATNLCMPPLCQCRTHTCIDLKRLWYQEWVKYQNHVLYSKTIYEVLKTCLYSCRLPSSHCWYIWVIFHVPWKKNTKINTNLQTLIVKKANIQIYLILQPICCLQRAYTNST